MSDQIPPALGVQSPALRRTVPAQAVEPKVERDGNGRLTRFGMEQVFKQGGTVLHSTPKIVDGKPVVQRSRDADGNEFVHTYHDHKLLMSPADIPSAVEFAKSNPENQKNAIADAERRAAESQRELAELKALRASEAKAAEDKADAERRAAEKKTADEKPPK